MSVWFQSTRFELRFSGSHQSVKWKGHVLAEVCSPAIIEYFLIVISFGITLVHLLSDQCYIFGRRTAISRNCASL